MDGGFDFEELAKANNIPQLSELWSVELDESPVRMALSPKGQLLAVGTAEDTIAVLDVGSGKVAHTLPGHDGGTNGLGFLSGNSLVSVGEDGKARLWNVARASCVHELAVDSEGADRSGGGGCCVDHLTLAPSGKAFACSAGKLVTTFRVCRLGDAPQQPPSKRVLGPLGSTVESLRYDRRGNLLATFNGGCMYWNFERKGEQRQALELPYAGACLSGDVTPDLEYIVVGCHDSTVHIWHMKEQRGSGVELQEMTCGGYDAKVVLLDFNAQGNRMASAGGDKNTVWDFSSSPTGTIPALTMGHQAAITCQAWQPDGEGWLATAGKDGRVLVYDVQDTWQMGQGLPSVCQPGAMALTGDEVTAMVFGREGLVYTGHISGTVRKWELPVAGGSEEEPQAAPAEQPQQPNASD